MKKKSTFTTFDRIEVLTFNFLSRNHQWSGIWNSSTSSIEKFSEKFAYEFSFPVKSMKIREKRNLWSDCYWILENFTTREICGYNFMIIRIRIAWKNLKSFWRNLWVINSWDIVVGRSSQNWAKYNVFQPNELLFIWICQAWVSCIDFECNCEFLEVRASQATSQVGAYVL